MLLPLGVAFLAGLVSFVSPCIVPIIPGFLSYLAGASLTQPDTKRWQIFLTSVFFVLGFSVVFAIIGVVLGSLLSSVAYETQVWLARIGAVLIMLFGVYLTGIIRVRFLEKEYKPTIKRKISSRYLKAFIFGAAFAAGWTPCVGAVLGSILVLAATQPGSALALLFAYSMGLGIPFMVVGLFAAQASAVIQRYSKAFSYANIVFGIILIVLGAWSLIDNIRHTTQPASAPISLAPAVPTSIGKITLPPAKELAGIAGFINTDPFTLKDLIGKKVILLDFWDYSCINCQRTTPYLNAWYDKYKDQGLVIVGIHTPEFDFEKKLENVKAAVEREGITYPVVLDNNYATWSAYSNRYWPRKYLIDIDGYIAYDHAGEGAYDETEQAIQKALAEKMVRLGENQKIDTSISHPTNVVAPTVNQELSPETYFGSSRNTYLANGKQELKGKQTLVLSNDIKPNALYLTGDWDFQDEYATNTSSNAHITYSYEAKAVYMVTRADKPVRMKIIVDGKPITDAMAGEDVHDGIVTVKEDRLYKLINAKQWGQHTLDIIIPDPGLDAYTFTFG